MADDNNPQHRADGSSGRAAGGGQGSDPLAELARLIGQNDPFSEFARSARAVAPAQQEPAPRDRPQTDLEDDGMRNPPGAADLRDPPGTADVYHAGQDTPPAGFLGRAEGGSYYSDTSQMPPRDDFYDDVVPSGRRRGVVTVIAVLALAVVGIAGAFGYRLMFGGVRSNALPQIIMANPEPTKVTPPAASSETPAGKLTYDRVGDRSQGERVIPREETPVDRKDLTRPSGSRSPSSPAIAANQGPTAVAPNTAAQSASVPLAEPKKVRTVAIRPDQPDAGAGPPALGSPGAAARPQAAMTPPPSATASSPVRTPPAAPPAAAPPAAATSATPQLRPAMPAVQSTPASPHGPLALGDETSPALPRTATTPRSAPAAPPQSAAPAPRPTPVPSPQAAASAPAASPPRTQVAAAAGGGYLVQLSSQRSEAEAQAAFRSLQAKYPDVLGGRQAVVRRAELGERGVFFRAMVGPFASRDQATQLCASLKAAGGDCIVQGN